jgi:hypothetical protein
MALPSLSDVGPAQVITAVTPSDTLNLPRGSTRGLLVGVAGAATVIDSQGNIVTGIPLQQGFNPISVSRVFATGLTASNIWALN